MANPLVSIILPVYNSEKYVKESIQSILDQTYTNLELIIINDASTDNSLEIINSFNDKRILVIENNSNIGIVGSLNKAIGIAKGEYIARMDSDDISYKNRVETQVEFMENNPEIGVLGSSADIIDKQGQIIRKFEVSETHPEIIWNLIFGNAFIHPSVMYKADLITANKYSESQHSEDLLLWSQLMDKTRFANINKSLIKYRDHNESISNQNSSIQSKKRKELIRLILEKLSINANDNVLEMIVNKRNAVQANSSSLTEFVSFLIILKDKLENLFNNQGENFSRLLINQINKIGQKKLDKRKNIFQKVVRKIFGNQTFYKSKKSNDDGLSIIVVSFERLKGLEATLQSLLNQKLQIPIEVILINNSTAIDLTENKYFILQKLYNSFDDFKIIQFGENLNCTVRFKIGRIAKFSNIFFIDDDLELKDDYFLNNMYHTYKELDRPILSCWTRNFVEYDEEGYGVASLGFTVPEFEDPVEVDVAGPGISMFPQYLLDDEELFYNPVEKYKLADDMAFSLIAYNNMNVKTYYFPSFNKVEAHKENTKNALSSKQGHYEDLNAQFKDLFDKGYNPVVNRENSISEEILSKLHKLKIRRYDWNSKKSN